MSVKRLKDKIMAKKARIGLVGLGYVGLPIALEFVKRGFFVYGLDNNKQRVDNLIKGSSYITDISGEDIKGPQKAKGSCLQRKNLY